MTNLLGELVVFSLIAPLTSVVHDLYIEDYKV